MEQTDTKARIVDAAIEAFLEKGYNSATIRDICARDEANLAAVNYHFGSKETLRVAALERVMASCQEKYLLLSRFQLQSFPNPFQVLADGSAGLIGPVGSFLLFNQLFDFGAMLINGGFCFERSRYFTKNS